MRELLKKLRQLLKPDALVPVVFLLVFFLVAGFFAITQETGDADNSSHGDPEGDSLSLEDQEEGIEPEFIPAGPPRWFRSNAGGMALEEIPSRLGALSYKYALVIDYVSPDELDPRLIPFYRDEYTIEIRILYKEKKESRKQWLFRDESGNTRVNAVFRPIVDKDEAVPDEAVPEEPGSDESALAAAEPETEASGEDAASLEDASSKEDGNQGEIALADTEDNDSESEPQDAEEETVAAGEDESSGEDEAVAEGYKAPEDRTPGGFIEVYNENGQIVRDYTLFQEGAEIITEYFYNGSTLIRAETKIKDAESMEYRKTHTDTYRYNRSYSLRNVERVFHEAASASVEADIDPVRLVFPGRVLDAAYEKDFLKENLTLSSDFLGSHLVGEGFRMVYDTDSKGRVLGETLYNDENEVVWTVKNTWVGDRITAILKIEDGEEKLTEYEYNGSGNRIAQRDIRNGVLERQVLINGAKETEELYLNGVMVLKAFWEDGRKISEERVRHR